MQNLTFKNKLQAIGELARHWETPEYIDLETRITIPWGYPREEADVILYPTADDNLKADIAVELLPEGTLKHFRYEDRYRGYNFGLRLLSSLDNMRAREEVVSHVQLLYEQIRDRFKLIPIEELSQQNNSIHELSVAATVIENELRIAGIDEEKAGQIASNYWRYSHSLKYAGQLDW